MKLIRMIVTNFWSGIYIQIILGPSEDKTTRALQFLGIAASLTSIGKGTADWWVRSKTNDFEEDPTFVETLKAVLFFIPHVIFQAFALTMCAGFLGYYVIGPITLIIIIVLCNAVPLNKKERDDSIPLTFFLTLSGTLKYRISSSL